MFSLKKVAYLKIGYFIFPFLVVLYVKVFNIENNLDRSEFFIWLFFAVYFPSIPTGIICMLVVYPLLESINFSRYFPYYDIDIIGFTITYIVLALAGYFQWFILVPKIIKGIAWYVDSFWRKH